MRSASPTTSAADRSRWSWSGIRSASISIPPKSIGRRRHRSEIRRGIAFVAAGIATAAPAAIALAQRCPPRIYRPPAVVLSFRVAACDYLVMLADRADASSNCQQMINKVAANPASRVHQLERDVADALGPVFAQQFGFLAWQATPPAQPNAWTIDVRLEQPAGRGTQSSLAVELRSGSTLVARSEALRFEEFDQVDVLSGETAAATRARWVKEIDSLLQASQGINRKKLIESVLRKVPLVNLATDPTPEAGSLIARLRMRDADIRVDSRRRPTFGLEVPAMEFRNATAPGSFTIGKCVSSLVDTTYKCRVLELAFGQDTQPPNAMVSFFRQATLHPPKLLYILDYEPARAECTFNGVFVQ